MDWKEQIRGDRLPKHVAITMDGNGRWAKEHGRPRVFGHRSAITAVRETTEAAAEIGIKVLTLYAFSTENWNRPRLEVSALMRLLIETCHSEINTLQKNNVRLEAIGELGRLPKSTYRALRKVMDETADNDRMTLVLALNYSGKWDLTQASRKIAREVEAGKLSSENITEDTLASYLATANYPEPELMIRTSGEKRISNFMLWQFAYTEFYFTPTFWPAFRKNDLFEAIVDFQQRERRFGKISEQLTT